MGWHPTQLHITMPWLAWANATHRQVYPVSPQPPKCKEPSDSNENLLHGKFLKHFVSLEGGAEWGGLLTTDVWSLTGSIQSSCALPNPPLLCSIWARRTSSGSGCCCAVHRFVRKQKKICRINLRRTQSQQQQQFSSQSTRRVRDDEKSRNTISKSLGFRVSRSGRTTVPYPYSLRCVRISFNRTLSKFEPTEAEREHGSEVISYIYRDLI
jgi:hypothetical protein